MSVSSISHGKKILAFLRPSILCLTHGFQISEPNLLDSMWADEQLMRHQSWRLLGHFLDYLDDLHRFNGRKTKAPTPPAHALVVVSVCREDAWRATLLMVVDLVPWGTWFFSKFFGRGAPLMCFCHEWEIEYRLEADLPIRYTLD